MKKILLIFNREYLTRVNKKSFLLTTLLVPVAIIIFYAAIIAIAISGDKESEKERNIAVIDESGFFNEVFSAKSSGIRATVMTGTESSAFSKEYDKLGFDAFLHIRPFSADSNAKTTLYSKSSIDLATRSSLEKMMNDVMLERRLKLLGLSADQFNTLSSSVKIETLVSTGEGEKKSFAEAGFAVSYACGILIYLMMLIYGTQVMRGVMEEKTSRISEVMVSSVKPFQLMMGKILGIGAVGLTQFLIWVILLAGLSTGIGLLIPGLSGEIAGATQTQEPAVVKDIMGAIQSLPIAKILSSFIFYFLFGYLSYAAIFAAIGSVTGDDQQDAQQFLFPVMMPIIIGFVIMTKAANDPYSQLAVFGSIFPLTSPIVMMGRISFDIPWWEIAASILLLAAFFIFITWMAGRIYRTGILMYGKKASWKELMKWAFRKN